MNSTAGTAPLAVIPCTDTFETIREVVSCLRSQAVHAEIELVIVAPSREVLRADEGALQGFQDVKIVELGPITTLSEMRTAGVRVAEADAVFLGETHSCPQAGWGAAMIAAHRGTAGVPGIANANPETAASWAGLLVDYGSWYEALPAIN